MLKRHPVLSSATPLLLLLGALGLLAAAQSGAAPQSAASASNRQAGDTRKYTTETVRGKVVWLDEALSRLYGVSTEPDATHTAVALETSDGHLLPIIPDTRGRAFAVDQRLRDIPLELPVRRYAGVPMIQVIRVLKPKADGLYEIDYWCDICAIPMVILKDCECCQGPTRLRERLVEPAADSKP
jgi:hypothetical protein